MSHFSVMVVTDAEPTEAVLSELMQPYHEFECTGTDDQYVQDIDKTSEFKKDCESHKDDYESEADFLNGWYGKKAIDLGQTPDLAGDHKYGYGVVSDGVVIKVIDRTNPNSKWDYWRIGGRYRAKLQVKQGVAEAVSTEPSWEWEPRFNDGKPAPVGFDQARVGDIDQEAMKQAAVSQRREWIEECMTKAEMDFDTFEEAVRDHQRCHKAWLELPRDSRPRGSAYTSWAKQQGYHLGAKASNANWELPELEDGQSLLDYINSAPSVSAFAVVMDGKWYERGRMGWWACVTDENEDWDSEFQKMFAGLRDDQWVSFLDCHI